MFPFELPMSLGANRTRNLKVAIGGIAFVAIFYSLAIASTSTSFDDAFLSQRPDGKVLFLTSDVVAALEVAKYEAEKQNVQFKRITRYILTFNKDTIQISISPPYSNGLDGPEFRAEIRRSDFKALRVINNLGVE